MPKLRSYVHVTDDAGYTHVFGPDSDVPVWAQAKIVNPDAWAEAPAAGPVDAPAEEPASPPAEPKRTTRRTRKVEAAED